MSSRQIIRTKPRTLDRKGRQQEWKRLGVKVSRSTADSPVSILDDVIDEYLDGTGATTGNIQAVTLKKGFVAPQNLSAAHLAFLEHADEETVSAIVEAGTPSSCRCYLVEKGLVPAEWLGAEVAIAHLGSKIWQAACAKALADQKTEGVLLNPLGKSILEAYVSDVFDRAQEDSQNVDYGMLKLDGKINFWPGGVECIKGVRKWIEEASIEEARDFARQEEEYRPTLIPWVLEYSLLAKTHKGASALILLLREEFNLSRSIWGIKSLLSNKHLGRQGREVLVEWALGRALSFNESEGEDYIIREIFKDFSARGESMGSLRGVRVSMALHTYLDSCGPVANSKRAQDHDRQRKAEDLSKLALVPYSSEDPVIRKTLLDLDDPYMSIEMLYHSVGQNWLELAESLIKIESVQSDVMEALRWTRKGQLAGLKPKDLAGLLGSKDRGVRTAVIRILGMVQELGQTNGESAEKGGEVALNIKKVARGPTA